MAYKIIKATRKTEDSLSLEPQNPIESIREVSDVAETIKALNDDYLQEDKFSQIDMKTRLHPIEVSSIIAVDSLVALDFLPLDTSFITRSKKRLAVSLDGLGRKEIVQIAQGIKEEQSGKSMMDRLSGVFTGK